MTQRISYFDWLRITATFAIIVLHVSLEWGKYPVATHAWQTYNLFQALTRWAVPVFVMISGALILPQEKSIKDIYTKNILRIFSAFFFWSCIYALLPAVRHQNYQNILPSILLGHFHMWFLPMIAGLYMIVPLIRPIIQSEILIRYLLWLCLGFAFVIPQITVGLSLLSPAAADLSANMTGSLKIHGFQCFLFYFVAGHFLHRFSMDKKMRVLCYFLGIAGFSMTLLLSGYASAYTHHLVQYFYESSSLNVLFESVGIFVFFKYHCNAETGKKMIAVSQSCFGIYLVHMYCVSAVNRLGLEKVVREPLLLIPVFSLAVFLLSACISLIGSRIPVVRKWCFGNCRYPDIS